jgi:hypothetical protein
MLQAIFPFHWVLKCVNVGGRVLSGVQRNGSARPMTGLEAAACLPDQVHWFSRLVLDYYLSGTITTGEFMRWFHMPNSDYLTVSECIVTQLDPHHDPLVFSPGILDGHVR